MTAGPLPCSTGLLFSSKASFLFLRRKHPPEFLSFQDRPLHQETGALFG
jgi:hypothetical protein